MLEKIGHFVVANRVGVVLLGIALLLISAVGMGNLEINYDFYSYLPSGLPSVIGQKMLSKDFGLSETLYVIVQNKTPSEVEEVIKRIRALPDVSETFWYSDVEDVKVPQEFASKEAKERFISGNDSLVQVKLAASGRMVKDQAEAVKAVVGIDGRVVGDYLYNKEIERLANSSKSTMLVIAVLAILFVLVLALTQPMYSVLFLITAGCAILVNLGLVGFTRGSMSFLTSSLAAALQLAVTMDYAIFLLHRYEEEKKTLPPTKAMAKAIAKTTVAVLSSATTTIAGFLALLFMSIRIGGDMGVVMAQGVGVGFVLTLTLLPSLILLLDKPLSKLHHRSLFPDMTSFAKVIVANKWLIGALLLIIAVPAFIGSTFQPVTYTLKEGIKLGDDVQADIDLVSKKLGGGKQVSVIMDGLDIKERLEVEERLSKAPFATSVFGPKTIGTIYLPSSYVPQKIVSKLESQGEYLLSVTVDVDSPEEKKQSFEYIKSIEGDYKGKVIATGVDMLQYDLGTLAERDSTNVTIATILGILLIVALALRRIGPAMLLVFAIQVAIWTNIAFQLYLGAPSMFFFAPIALGAIQLGATVDYSILIATRFEEEKKKMGAKEAMIVSIREGAPAVITSALTLFGACAAISLTSQIIMVQDLSMLLARGALVSMVVVLTAVPAILLSYEQIVGALRRKNA